MIRLFQDKDGDKVYAEFLEGPRIINIVGIGQVAAEPGQWELFAYDTKAPLAVLDDDVFNASFVNIPE